MTTATALFDLQKHREELRAEYRATTSDKEMKQIFDELWLVELMIVSLEWKLEKQARQPG